MEKEILEEAAEKQWGKLAIINDRAAVIAFKAGAKWQAERMGLMEIELRHTKTLLTSCEKALEDRDKQAERMYSEEDMKEAFRVGFNVGYNDEESPSYLTFEKWFEQFKKK